jgi:hypothetical protein
MIIYIYRTPCGAFYICFALKMFSKVRSGCSIAVTLFQLGDSCRTTSHRDYLMLLAGSGAQDEAEVGFK